MPIMFPPDAVIPLTQKKMRYACGHETWANWYLRISGRHVCFGMGVWPVATGPCGDCELTARQKLVIQCCKCARAIMLGEGIAVYPEPTLPLQEHYTMTLNKKYIGCMDSHCCPDIKEFVTATWSVLVGPFVGFSSNDGRDDPPDR